jgi:hypothetical protein
MAKTSTGGIISRVCDIYLKNSFYYLCSFSRDFAIAIHNEERREYHEAQLRKQQHQPQHSQGYHYEQASRKSKKKHRNRSDHDDDGCILS